MLITSQQGLKGERYHDITQACQACCLHMSICHIYTGMSMWLLVRVKSGGVKSPRQNPWPAADGRAVLLLSDCTGTLL